MKQYLNFKSFLFDCFDATSGCKVLIHLGFSRSSSKGTWFYSVAIDWSLQNNCRRRDDSQCSSTVGIYWNTTLLRDWAFPLWVFMLKLHGDAILPDDKRYFIYENSWARLVTVIIEISQCQTCRNKGSWLFLTLATDSEIISFYIFDVSLSLTWCQRNDLSYQENDGQLEKSFKF